MPAFRRDHDDLAFKLPFFMCKVIIRCRLTAEVCPLDIDGKDAVPFFFAHLQKRFTVDHTRIFHYNIQAAEQFRRFFHDGIRTLYIGHIPFDRMRLHTVPF